MKEVYPSNPECIVVVYDLREPRAAEQLHRSRASWQEDSDIAALDEYHFVLILHLGDAARRLVA
jgi:hypothetical protein